MRLRGDNMSSQPGCCLACGKGYENALHASVWMVVGWNEDCCGHHPLPHAPGPSLPVSCSSAIKASCPPCRSSWARSPADVHGREASLGWTCPIMGTDSRSLCLEWPLPSPNLPRSCCPGWPRLLTAQPTGAPSSAFRTLMSVSLTWQLHLKRCQDPGFHLVQSPNGPTRWCRKEWGKIKARRRLCPQVSSKPSSEDL